MEIALFALNAAHRYGGDLSRALGVVLSPLEERQFEDGEHKARPLVSVRNKDVFVVQSLYSDATGSIDDKLLKLLFFIGSLRSAHAARITAVLPYLAFARQDRAVEAADPITTRYVAELFAAVGTDHVMTLDVHNLVAFENAFARTEHLEAGGLFAAHFGRTLGGRDVTVVSPDAGGVSRAERFRRLLAVELGRPVGFALMEKYRSDGVLEGEVFGGEVQGRIAIIFDDMIATGGTIARTARACRRHGAVEIYAAATHGLFVGRANVVLSQANLTGLVVTDTIPTSRLPGIGIDTDVTVLETAPLVAEAIRPISIRGNLRHTLA
jgi:ribose-phosphate pyrophosphokinase